MEYNRSEQESLAEDIQQLMQEAKKIQEDPLAFLHHRQHLLGDWMGQSLKN